jgi:AraC-like DNA-binding protein
MYFTRIPNHKSPTFDEERHFNQFKQCNIIFNVKAERAYCERLKGCLSVKIVSSGEEWYHVNNHQLAVRPGQFLILNDEQDYTCRADSSGEVRIQSVFFTKAFSSAVFHDALSDEEMILDDPFEQGQSLEFFQTLYETDEVLRQKIGSLIAVLDDGGYQKNVIDEHLVFLLHYLIRVHKKEAKRANEVKALKHTTRKEIYRRLCIAKDFMHSSFMGDSDLSQIGNSACLSTPQLVRQFKAVFGTTPHQYLLQVRFENALSLLRNSSESVQEITGRCGFKNTSAFCRAFKGKYGVSPLGLRIGEV